MGGSTTRSQQWLTIDMVYFIKDTGFEPLPAVFFQTAKGNSKRCKRVDLLSTCVLQGDTEFVPLWYSDAT